LGLDRWIKESTEKTPAPPRIKDTNPAIYSRATSYPGGPNTGPSGVNPMVAIELKPYFRWTVNIATSIMVDKGIAVIVTKAPRRIANPPKSSKKGAIHEVKCGNGAPTFLQYSPNEAVPQTKRDVRGWQRAPAG